VYQKIFLSKKVSGSKCHVLPHGKLPGDRYIDTAWPPAPAALESFFMTIRCIGLYIYRVRRRSLDLCRWCCPTHRGSVQDGTAVAAANHLDPCVHCTGWLEPATHQLYLKVGLCRVTQKKHSNKSCRLIGLHQNWRKSIAIQHFGFYSTDRPKQNRFSPVLMYYRHAEKSLSTGKLFQTFSGSVKNEERAVQLEYCLYSL